MLKRMEIQTLNDFFSELGKRRSRGVYFYRINGYNQEIHQFIQRYYDAARLSGVIIEGRLKNPDTQNLSYYHEIMGMNFQLSMGFLTTSLKKWLPRMNSSQVENVAGSIYDTLMDLRKAGKNDNMLKNAYIKFMCWLYYRFERIVNHLGEEKLPKILYEGTISNYELLLMNVLSIAGCDIVLLQYQGDADYLKTDPSSTISTDLKLPEMKPFPAGFSLKKIREDIQNRINRERLYGSQTRFSGCANAWLTGETFEDIQKDPALRGTDGNFFYNCFLRITGVEDKLLYQNTLYQLQLELRARNRQIVILNQAIQPPSPEEVSSIQRKSCQNLNQLILDLSRNIQYPASPELQKIMHKAFVDLLFEEGEKGENLNRLTNKGVYLLCWLKRYQSQLFKNWKMPEIACFFYMGGCRNENEALFCRLLARLPVDVVIFTPDINQKCALEDNLLYEVHYPLSMPLSEYPSENSGARVGTAAFHAEREMDTMLYQDTGIYRNQQFEKANTISLQTMYEEIAILWKEDLKYRPGFDTRNGEVSIPVIFSKISGVKDGNVSSYWLSIKQLLTEETILVQQSLTSTTPNPIKPFTTKFYKHDRLQKSRIKQHRAYPYGVLRESIQDYLLDKLQLLIDQKLIFGTGENGTEYTIISTALNLDKRILRMIQNFDFAKKNPKLIYILTGETVLSLEDSICAAYLNLVGFDILFFVPTGYQSIEKFFNRNIIEEHQIGTYMYDLSVPDFDTVTSNTRHSWRDFIFKRGI